MSGEITPAQELPGDKILVYQTEDGRTRISVRMTGETVWLTQGQMAELFQTTIPNINIHIHNIFHEKELREDSVIKDYLITAADGKKYQTKHYNLDVIISVGYRVKSPRGTQFRIWATQRLREYIVKGFTMDDERLKQAGGGGYFDELLARSRDIRSSEKVFWRKVLDIYATSMDYDQHSDLSQRFFATVQNKMPWAAHGHTAAEIVAARASRPKRPTGEKGQEKKKGRETMRRNGNGRSYPNIPAMGTGMAVSGRHAGRAHIGGLGGPKSGCRHFPRPSPTPRGVPPAGPTAIIAETWWLRAKMPRVGGSFPKTKFGKRQRARKSMLSRRMVQFWNKRKPGSKIAVQILSPIKPKTRRMGFSGMLGFRSPENRFSFLSLWVYNLFNIRAAPLIRKDDAHKGRVFFVPVHLSMGGR